MTFTIIGIDKKRKEFGIACFSKAFGVGGIVPEIDLSIGAIAVQSYPNVLYKKNALELFKKKIKPEKILNELIKKDKGRELRQVLLMTSKGKSFGFTGDRNVSFAGHKIGKNCIAGGNMLTGKEVLDTLVNYFEKTKGGIAERLINSLKNVGTKGDKRNYDFGSAGLIVEKKGKGILGFGNRYIDLRIDYSKDAINDLNKLLKIRKS